jgi:hypothetical protein
MFERKRSRLEARRAKSREKYETFIAHLNFLNLEMLSKKFPKENAFITVEIGGHKFQSLSVHPKKSKRRKYHGNNYAGYY